MVFARGSHVCSLPCSWVARPSLPARRARPQSPSRRAARPRVVRGWIELVAGCQPPAQARLSRDRGRQPPARARHRLRLLEEPAGPDRGTDRPRRPPLRRLRDDERRDGQPSMRRRSSTSPRSRRRRVRRSSSSSRARRAACWLRARLTCALPEPEAEIVLESTVKPTAFRQIFADLPAPLTKVVTASRGPTALTTLTEPSVPAGPGRRSRRGAWWPGPTRP